MKEKKAGRIIILAAFALIICLSEVIWGFAGKNIDTETPEKRLPAERPELTFDTYGSFSSDYTSYFNDNLPFRDSLVTLDSGIDYFCFGRSNSEHVAIGSDNWLFYTREDDGDPIGCYQGTNLFSEDELNAIAANCLEMRDLMESEGREFVILIVPNKERIYPEYMPERYGKPADNYGALQIYEHLKNNTDLRVVYPCAELMAAKEKVKENICYKTDSHWNRIGGYIGASALMKELGIEMPPVDSITVKSGEKHSGDLAEMLSLEEQLLFADREYTVEGYDTHDLKCTRNDFYKMISYHAAGADPRCLYVIRDSFASQMAEYLGSQFNDTYLRYKYSYSYDDLQECDPDIVVYETVERYAGDLAAFSIRR